MRSKADPVERAAVDHQILQDWKRASPPWLEVHFLAVFEMPQVKLADCRSALRPVRHAIDHEPAHAADAFAAIVVESDRVLALLDQPFVEHVQHFQKRHVLVHAGNLVAHHAPPVLRIFLPPDVECEFHFTCNSAARA